MRANTASDTRKLPLMEVDVIPTARSHVVTPTRGALRSRLPPVIARCASQGHWPWRGRRSILSTPRYILVYHTHRPWPLTFIYDLEFQFYAIYGTSWLHAREKKSRSGGLSRFKRRSGNEQTDGRTDRQTRPIAYVPCHAVGDLVTRTVAAAAATAAIRWRAWHTVITLGWQAARKQACTNLLVRSSTLTLTAGWRRSISR